MYVGDLNMEEIEILMASMPNSKLEGNMLIVPSGRLASMRGSGERTLSLNSSRSLNAQRRDNMEKTIRKSWSEITLQELAAAYAAGFSGEIDGDKQEVILWK